MLTWGLMKYYFSSVIFGEVEVFFEVCLGFVFGLFLTPLLARAIEETSGADVLVPPSNELRVINSFFSTGSKTLALLELFIEVCNRLRRRPLASHVVFIDGMVGVIDGCIVVPNVSHEFERRY